MSFVDNVSKVWGAHSIKAGVYIEHTEKFQVGGKNPRGAFDFSSTTTNPFDSGDGFSNALLGVINTYSEGTARVNGDWIFNNLEFYVQDNWRVSKRLTLDIGMRFYHLPPQTDTNQTIAGFNPSLYSRANAPMLYMPIIDPSGKRVAVDPRTGALYANPLIGQYITGTGSVSNGAAIGGQNGYPGGLYTTSAMNLGPRLGFAWDVFGTGKTAVRGGFGMFKDRLQGNPTMDTNGNPPVSFAPTLYYGSLDTYAASGGAIGPSTINNLMGFNQPATTMNWSFGIQQQLKNMAIEASYVGSVAYHLIAQKDINPIPIGAHFNTAFQDPSQPGKPLADNFLRPYLRMGQHQHPQQRLQLQLPFAAGQRATPLLRRTATWRRLHLLQGAGRGRWRYLRGQPILLAALPQLRPRGLRPSAAVRGQLRLRAAESRHQDELQAGQGRVWTTGKFPA